MKTALNKIFIIACCSAFITGCSKSDSAPAPANPYGGNNGQLTIFSSNLNNSIYPISVNIDGHYTGSIAHIASTTPDCDNTNDGVVKFDAAPGVHNMFATAANGGTWSGSITITASTCITQGLN